jgi:hypothetical protein
MVPSQGKSVGGSPQTGIEVSVEPYQLYVPEQIPLDPAAVEVLDALFRGAQFVRPDRCAAAGASRRYTG